MMTDDELAVAFDALSNARRITVLRALARGPLNTRQLAAAGGSQDKSFADNHLSRLEGAGFVSRRRQGKAIVYSLQPAALGRLAEALDGLHRLAARSAPAPDGAAAAG